MIKVTSEIFEDKQIGEYSFKKSVNDNMIIEEIEADLSLQNQEAKNVIEKTITGERRSDANLTINCGTNEITKNAYLSYNEGKLDLQGCRVTKKIFLNNQLDCAADGEINIYDYNPINTATVQGELLSFTYSQIVYQYFFDDYTYADVIALLDQFDRSNEGYFIEHITIECITELDYDEVNQFDSYLRHRIELQAKYVKIKDTVQHSPDWLPDAGGGFYFNLGNPEITLSSSNYVFINDSENERVDRVWSGGRATSFQNTDISNTYVLNDILEDVFLCTGLTVKSCFFGINSDGSNPVNSAYDFATSTLHNIRIAQSFDIIREDELEDSSGSTGIIKREEIIQDICKLFNIVIIKTVNEVRIEHASYYINKGIDVTNIDYEIEEIEVNKDLVSSEIFQYAAKTNSADHFEVKIEYEKPRFSSDTNEVIIKSELFITDVLDCLNNEEYNESEYEDLFFLLSCDNQGKLIEFNKRMSMRSIFFALHTTQRPFRQGNYKNTVVNFGGYSLGFSTKLKMISAFINYENLQPFYSVKTNEGTFLITEIEFNENKELILSLKK